VLKDRSLRNDRAKNVIDVWKTIVGVQMHFNELAMRIRGLFITILIALFASIGFLIDKQLSLQLWRLNIQYAVLVPLFGIFGAMLFYLIDRYWYHRLLKGAVNHAIKIEQKFRAELPELSLSEEIGKESFFIPKRWSLTWIAAKLLVRHERFGSKGQIHSDAKLEIFYKSVMAVLACLSVFLAAFGGVSFDKKGDRNSRGQANSDRYPASVSAQPAPPTQFPTAAPQAGATEQSSVRKSAAPAPPSNSTPAPAPAPTPIPAPPPAAPSSPDAEPDRLRSPIKERSSQEQPPQDKAGPIKAKN
jgi:hypothetical protein